jgi:carboxypeptidase Q
MQNRGEKIVVTLKMAAKTLPDAPSRNAVAEIRGSEKPDEVVVLGGHIDSWDVGQGAMDDGGCSVAAWEAVRLMKQLGITPKRTVRVVLVDERGERRSEAVALTVTRTRQRVGEAQRGDGV